MTCLDAGREDGSGLQNVNKIFRNITFWVVALALAGYGLALLIGDKVLLEAAHSSAGASNDSSLFYELILAIKEAPSWDDRLLQISIDSVEHRLPSRQLADNSIVQISE